MLIERQIAVALIALSPALVFPGINQVINERNFHVSLGMFITANLLVGAGLALGWFVFYEDSKIKFTLLAGLIALAFSSGTAYIAFFNSGLRAFWLGTAAVVPVTAFVLGFKFRNKI